MRARAAGGGGARGGVAFVTALVLGVVMVGAALPADASTSWSVQPTPSPTASSNGSMSSVSCPTATSCFAVGVTGASQLYTQRWNGTMWAFVAAPRPFGAQTTALSSVSCASATSCIAVGSYTKSGPPKTLVEQWDGSRWTILASPTPSGGAGGALNGVSCMTTTSCVAVGGSGLVTLVEQWDGSKWTVVPSPTPSGGSGFSEGSFNGVSCVSASSCVAVGLAVDGVLVEMWNGISWSIVPTPALPSREFYGVTCTSATNCFAVGLKGGTLLESTLIEHWDGVSWSESPNIDPGGAHPEAALNSVSCVTASNCFAVGWTDTDEFPHHVIVKHWDGSIWSVQPTPDTGFGATLNGVTCASSSNCVAVGSKPVVFGSTTLAERWDGKSWSIVAGPHRGSQSRLVQVSCTTASNCFAVGFAESQSRRYTLIEHWNGTRWSIVPSPNASGFEINELHGVSCPTTARCFAVGHSTHGSATTQTLIERWDGKSWSIVPSPNSAHTVGSQLSSVSCAGPTTCFAACDSSSGYLKQTSLIERWNGAAWSIVASPNLPSETHPNTFLHGVSCVTASRCFAVGYYAPTLVGPFGNFPVIEQLNGTSWTIAPSPPPAGGAQGTLNGISCAGASSCIAVGDSASHAFVESWSGTTWSIVANPFNMNELLNVSCATGASCVAVGSGTLVAGWNGVTWSVVTAPNPSGIAGTLEGINCLGATACTAVGNYIRGPYRYTLAEQQP